MVKRRVAVITDSMSPGFYFPLWYKYYANQFGWDSINLLTLPGMAEAFSAFQLASVQEMNQFYDDDFRLAAMTRRVSELLETHEVVIRVDTDEFLVPEPHNHRSLADYVDKIDAPYITARGFDVFQTTSEKPLNFGEAILVQQRGTAFALNAMNKTCITRIPLGWNRGFHYCSRLPNLCDLFLFHLKRADIETQLSWNKHLSSMIVTDDLIRGYYQTPPEKVLKFHRDLSGRTVEDGAMALYRDNFYREYLGSIHKNPRTGIFEGRNHVELVNVRIPEHFRGAF